MTNEELALKLLKDELGDREATPENILEASIAATRKTIYMDYHWAKPEVVEALLLLLRNFLEKMFEEIAKMDDSDEAEYAFVRQIAIVSIAMRKTIDQLYSV